MKRQTVIVGLPNIGKLTHYSVLTVTQGAKAANYPFCTLNPMRTLSSTLSVLVKINESIQMVPVTLGLVDVAGLVKGASAG